MIAELESDLLDTVDWGQEVVFNFNAGKPPLVLFDWSNNTGAIDIKMDGPILDEKSYFGIFWGSVTNINIKINTEHDTTAKYRPDNSKFT